MAIRSVSPSFGEPAGRGPVADPRGIGRTIPSGRSLWVLGLLIVFTTLGIANMVARARAHEVEDGVLWADRPEGVTALEVAPESPGARAGVQVGDVLVAVDGEPVTARADVLGYQHVARVGTTLRYTVAGSGDRRAVDVALALTLPGTPMYIVLAAVGLFTLFVGGSVRLRRPYDHATLHFFWLCVAFFGAFTFSFIGPFDPLDWVFYWGDVVALALMPPLLLHFMLVFPERAPEPAWSRGWWAMTLLYAPAFGLVLGRIFAIGAGAIDGPRLSSVLELLDRAELAYLFVCVVIALVVVVRAFYDVTTLTGRRQLRWLMWGAALGVGPFACAYALPWSLGADPSLVPQLTVVPLGLVPLAFASAIVRYRLRDVEVIIKRGLGYAAFLAASTVLYFAMLRLAEFVFPGADPRNWVLALLSTVVFVLLAQPVREAVQNAVDRLFYRDRYDYRRALVGFARDLNGDLDVVRLSRRLVARVVETLIVGRMAVLLADDRADDFRSIADYGFADRVPRLPRSSSFTDRLERGHTVALDDPMAAAWFTAEEVEFWRDQGIFYMVPCTFEGSAIALLALGPKNANQPFSSEDLALLTAVAGQAATAIENGRLYRQLHVKAQELGRMREFNDNILESLDDGLVVFDSAEHIVRWNRALENTYGLMRADAVGRRLADVFDQPFVEAVRAALVESPRGARLFKVPLAGKQLEGGPAERPRLLVNATAVPLQNPSERDGVSGTILLIEDLTDRVRLEEQLQISEKMASIGLLAAGVAHEVNTPLTGISSFTQMLLDGADPSDPRTPLLEKIERQTFRAAKIVNGLLTLSRPGTPSGDKASVDLNTVIGDVFSLLEHQFSVGKIRVRRELSPLPVMVLGIEHQLQQVFLNLFLNARDAMPRGGWLTVTTRIELDGVVAEIADTGSGIPPEQLARIYDPFFTTKAIGRGTGLGLSITYGIVREHQGVIHCDSVVGQGTRFTLTMPGAPEVVRAAASSS
jgi:signal transduction histidine kinase